MITIHINGNEDLYSKTQERLDNDKTVIAIIGCWDKRSINTILPLLESYKVLFFYINYIEVDICSQVVFYIGPTYRDILATYQRYFNSLDNSYFVFDTSDIGIELLDALNRYTDTYGLTPIKYSIIDSNVTSHDYYLIVNKIRYALMSGGSIIDYSVQNKDKYLFTRYVYDNILIYNDRLPYKFRYYTLSSLYYLSEYFDDEELQNFEFMTSFIKGNDTLGLLQYINQVSGYNSNNNETKRRKYILSTFSYLSYLTTKLIAEGHKNYRNNTDKYRYNIENVEIELDNNVFSIDAFHHSEVNYFYTHLSKGNQITQIYKFALIPNTFIDTIFTYPQCIFNFSLHQYVKVGIINPYLYVDYIDIPSIIYKTFKVFKSSDKSSVEYILIVRGISNDDEEIKNEVKNLLFEDVAIILGGHPLVSGLTAIQSVLSGTNVFLLTAFHAHGIDCFDNIYFVGSVYIEKLMLLFHFIYYKRYDMTITLIDKSIYLYDTYAEIIKKNYDSFFLKGGVYIFKSNSDWIFLSNYVTKQCKDVEKCVIIYISFSSEIKAKLYQLITSTSSSRNKYVLINLEYHSYDQQQDFNKYHNILYVGLSPYNDDEIGHIPGYEDYDILQDTNPSSHAAVSMTLAYIVFEYFIPDGLFPFDRTIDTPAGEMKMLKNHLMTKKYYIKEISTHNVLYNSTVNMIFPDSIASYQPLFKRCSYSEEMLRIEKPKIAVVIIDKFTNKYEDFTIGLLSKFRSEFSVLNYKILYYTIVFNKDSYKEECYKDLDKLSKNYTIVGIFGCNSKICLKTFIPYAKNNSLLIWSTNSIEGICSLNVMNVGLSMNQYFKSALNYFLSKNFFSTVVIYNEFYEDYVIYIRNYYNYVGGRVLEMKYNPNNNQTFYLESIKSFNDHTLIVILFLKLDLFSELNQLDRSDYPIYVPFYKYLNYTQNEDNQFEYVYSTEIPSVCDSVENKNYFQSFGVKLEDSVLSGYLAYTRWVKVVNTVKSFDYEIISNYMEEKDIQIDSYSYFNDEQQLSVTVNEIMINKDNKITQLYSVSNIFTKAFRLLWIYPEHNGCHCNFDDINNYYECSTRKKIGLASSLTGQHSSLEISQVLIAITAIDLYCKICIFIFIFIFIIIR